MSARNKVRYQLSKKIGEGGGEVFLAYDTKEKVEVAVKKIDFEKLKENQPAYVASETEIEFLLTVNSPHIIKLLDWQIDGRFLYQILEYCEEGTLGDMLRSRKLSEQESLEIFLQIMNGFKVLQEEGIIHRDIKPDNIFRSSGIYKIADFGHCKRVNSKDRTNSFCGSPCYMPPEIMKGEEYDDKCDIWSLGVLLYEMIYGSCPITSNTIEEYNEKLFKPEIVVPMNCDDKIISTKAINLLYKLLQKAPANRFIWQELFEYCDLVKKMMANNIKECIFAQKNKLDMRCKHNKDMDYRLRSWIEEEYGKTLDVTKKKVQKSGAKMRQGTVNELFEKMENQASPEQNDKIELEVEANQMN